MKLHQIREYYAKFIAKENIKNGDVVKIIFKRFIRKARSKDTNFLGFSMGNYKKGEEVKDISTESFITLK
jgi:hypothetical protein